MKNELNFQTALTIEILASLHNHYTDNHDPYRFGKLTKKSSLKYIVKKNLTEILSTRRFYWIPDKQNKNAIQQLQDIDPYWERLNNLYNSLADKESKDLLLKLLAFRVLGNSKVKLPINTPDYWEGIRKIERITNFDDSIKITFRSWSLSLIDLNKINIPIKLYFSPIGVFIDFILKQYEYSTPSKTIKVNKGDYVIDAGGCFGDTALFFANEVGDEGSVYTYEFIPSNLAILKKNISLNPILARRIKVIEKPVWEVSELTMYFVDNGPGSTVSVNNSEKSDGNVNSLSIDDLVEQRNILTVNFIKMDIEGAESSALKGAEKTIKKFTPKLAIAVYHSMNDFVNIAAYIKSLNLGYQIYLGHYTIHAEETILFAETINP